MTYADFTGKMIVESWGRFKAIAIEAVSVGDLVYFDSSGEGCYLADAEDSKPANAVALEDIAAAATGWFALAAIVKKPPTISTTSRGAVTRGDHSGTAMTALYLDGSADEGEACESAGTIAQQVGWVLSQDEVLLQPMPYLTGVNIAASGTLSVAGNSTLGGTLAVTGNTTVGGTLGVTGAVTLTAGITVGTTLAVTGATTLTGAAAINGALTLGVTDNVDSAYTILATDQIVNCTLTTARTVTLPTAVKGRCITVHHESGDAILTIAAGSGDKILDPTDGGSSDTIADDKTLGSFVTLVALDTTTWMTIASRGTWTGA